MEPDFSDADHRRFPLHPDLAVLSGLIGTWAGAGTGSYPTIETFGYLERITVTHGPKPFLSYTQRTWAADDGRPLHVETGYLRVPSPSRVEFIVSHATGVSEIGEGSLIETNTGFVLAIESTSIGLPASATQVTAVNRTIRLAADQLSYELEMAAVGHPLTHHLAASLQQVHHA
jgi:hypothetical protein